MKKNKTKTKEKDFGEKVLEIVNKWGECTSEGGIYWEIGFWGDKRGKDPEKEIAKEVNKLLNKIKWKQKRNG